ncbi:unnamed protein product [Caenorhabditis angaria]|uniref:3-hydroxyisobutyryl-CoA hydrolase, mitochondrial n=1 Tax=Caenorhabditis angaria TaxID=860376 RepID=A0A9P1IK27_9PELO|nr:unnamed protein product [Caenorhabditis angaria]
MSLAVRSLLRNTHQLKMFSAPFSLSTVAQTEILVEKQADKRIVTLNRPKALNALNLNMVREFYPMMKEWQNSKDVSLVILKGSGEKAFCAGGDVLAVSKSYKEAAAGGETTMHKDFFREEYILNHLIGTFSKQYVSLIDGIVMGGGCGLSVNGRFRVATEKTMLAMPETALGLFPDVGGSYFLSRLKDNLGMFLALTGYRLLGADTFHAGMATHFVESSSLGDLQNNLTNLKNVTESAVDKAIKSLEPSNIPEFSLSNHITQIKNCFGGRSIEEIIQNLEKDGSDWAKKQIQTLNKMSPTSLKITHRQISEGARLSYSKIFTMEYRLTQRFLEDPDFHEGCRAILIDKDRNPKWNPAKLADVTEETMTVNHHKNGTLSGELNEQKCLPLKDKWLLVPAFLKVRGLVKQHLVSFDHFVNEEIRNIMLSNQKITSDANSNFYLKYNDIRIGKPSSEEGLNQTHDRITPQECRLRDMTYSAPISVDIEYTRGNQRVFKKDLVIGRMPIMLRSSKCILKDLSEEELARVQECPHDPGGYFVVKGSEKVILIQEQLSKNRIMVGRNSSKELQCEVLSSTSERKSKTYVTVKKGKYLLRHNQLTDDVPVTIIFKAMGIESDYDIVSTIGHEEKCC